MWNLVIAALVACSSHAVILHPTPHIVFFLGCSSVDLVEAHRYSVVTDDVDVGDRLLRTSPAAGRARRMLTKGQQSRAKRLMHD